MPKKYSLGEVYSEIANIKNDLIGNGQKGLIRKVDEIRADVIKLKENMKIKMWIYRGTIAFLIAVTTFLATQRWG